MADLRRVPLWMLDIDGPVTDPQTRQIGSIEVLDGLIDAALRGHRIAFNTGRSTTWVAAAVIAPLVARSDARGVDAAAVLDRCILVAEKGAILARPAIDDAHAVHLLVDVAPTAAVAPTLLREIAALVERDYSDVMFVDASKQTMASVEMAHGAQLTQYQERQPDFARAVRAIVAQSGADLDVDVTTIAVDVQSRQAGKQFGTDRILAAMASDGEIPQRAVVVGDSGSDLAMADRLHERIDDIEVTYVNVGSPAALDSVAELRYTMVHALSAPGAVAPAAFTRGTVAAMQRDLG